MQAWPVFWNAKGRIGRQAFWWRWAILAGLGGVVILLGKLGSARGALFGLTALILAYFWACLMLRRLHDLGQDWRALALLWIATTAAAILLFRLTPLIEHLAALVAGERYDLLWLMISQEPLERDEVVDALMAAPCLSWFWLGIAPGASKPNRFGPPPGQPDPVALF